MDFSASQLEAIHHKDGPALILAGPGSGKTAVITERTRQLILEYGVNPSNILVITFTRAAAGEMRERFFRLMGGKQYPVTFGTFHAVFFTILKYAYHFHAGNIIREDVKYQYMREIVTHMGLEYEDENEFLSSLLGEIGMVKNAGIPLDNYYSANCPEGVFRKIYRTYDDKLRRNRLLDFDDMLVYTDELFRERKDILAAWQKKYRYILIDEFQDINKIQFDIMKMLALPENNLFVVGDDDQSIYRFRGAKPEIMLHFDKDYPNTKKSFWRKTIVLEQESWMHPLSLLTVIRNGFIRKFMQHKKQADWYNLRFMRISVRKIKRSSKGFWHIFKMAESILI